MIVRHGIAWILTALLIGEMAAPPAVAQATLAGGLTVGALLSQLEATADRIIEKAADKADEVLLRAAYAAEIAVANLRVAYAESLDKTLASLDKLERDSFQRVHQLVGDLDQALDRNLVKAAKISKDLTLAARALPFSLRDPIVTGWDPLYFIARSPGTPVQVSVSGIHLAAGEPRLVARGLRLSPTLAKTDDLLTFELPARLFPKERFEPLRLDLVVFKRVRRWLVVPSLEERRYRISVFPVPAVIGSFVVHAKQEIHSVTEEARRSGEMKCHAPHCESDSESARVSIAEPNVALKPGSVRFDVSYENHGSYSIHDESASGFAVVLKCESYGCGPFWSGTRGQIKGTAAYTVIKKSTNIQEVAAGAGELRWARDIRLSTPPDTLTVTVEMTTMLGEVETLTPGRRGRFYSVEFDRVAGELIIHPATLPDVLRAR